MTRNKNSAAQTTDGMPDEPLSPQFFLKAITDLGAMLATLYDRRTGLTRNQTRIVIALLENDGQTQTELANALSIHKVSVGIYVNELEARGLVERRTHPTDRRAKCICVTPYLHTRKHIGLNHYTAIHNAATSGIDEADYLTMLKSMQRMRDNLLALDELEQMTPDIPPRRS
tara:strand:+ start:1359 stop:1874 length:516 start_codon:yes stop_codon:yes gene_type:complete